MSKSQPEDHQDTGLKPDKPVPDGNKDAFNALLRKAVCKPQASEQEEETSDQA